VAFRPCSEGATLSPSNRLTNVRAPDKLLIGVIHLPPLPGSPGYRGAAVDAFIERARQDADAILKAGWHGYVLENFGDAPFYKDRVPPHVVSFLTRIAAELPGAETIRGINVLRNDPQSALAVAAAAGFDFVRVNVHVGAMVTDQGIIEGRAAETIRERELWAPSVAIAADVAVKHAYPLGDGYDLNEAAKETVYRGMADALIVTGKGTGVPIERSDLTTVRRAVPDRPLLVGSGVTPESLADILQEADGVIVGTAIKKGGNVLEPVDPDRAILFARTATTSSKK
jgi:membrane complex biogenesis BtpA family protein